MKKPLIVLGTILAIAVVGAATWPVSAGAVPAAPQAGSDNIPDGQRIFLDQKCDMCHDVSNVGIEATTRSERLKGGDIKGLDMDPDWLALYLKREEELDGKKHQKGFTGSDEELKNLIEWALSQK